MLPFQCEEELEVEQQALDHLSQVQFCEVPAHPESFVTECYLILDLYPAASFARVKII